MVQSVIFAISRACVGVLKRLPVLLLAALPVLTAPGVARAQSPEVVRKIDVLSNGGRVTVLSDGTAWFAASGAPPDSLGVRAYAGSQAVVQAAGAGGGVVTLFSGGGAYFSPDGMNLGGGGLSIAAYTGRQRVVRLAAVNGGVVTQFDGGAAYFSPDGRNLGGGGSTVRAYAGTQSIVELEEIPGAVRTRFSGGGVYISPDGRNLGGGGATLRTPAWHRFRESAEFGPRDSAKGLRQGSEMYLSSGFYRSPATSYSDLWRSRDDGATWELMAGYVQPMDVPPADFYEPYSPIRPAAGGLIAVGSQVWSSGDGKTWAPISPGPVRASEDVFAFVFDGRYVLINTYYGRVHTSPDGLVWDAGTTIPGFERRCGAAVIAAFGKLWIQGGGRCDYSGFFDDIWSSSDGVTWAQEMSTGTSAPLAVPWQGRMWPAVCRDDETLWMIGGFRIDGDARSNLADIWYTRDGLEWKPLAAAGSTAGAPPSPRHAATCYLRAQQKRLVMVAGKGGPDGNNDRARVLNDVWSLELPATLP